MKGNIWLPLIFVGGFLVAVVIACITVFKIRKLELAYQAVIAEKQLVIEALKFGHPKQNRISMFDNLKSAVKKFMVEICPSFIVKFLGF